MSRAGSGFWKVLVVLGCVTCQWLAHLAVSEGEAGALRLALMVLPLLALAYWAVAHARNKPLWLLIVLAAGAAVYALAHQDGLGLAVTYGVPHAAAYLFLLWSFGRTLRHGSEALITRLARRVHRTLPPYMEAYTRRLTIAWCVFFATQVTLSGLLFTFAALDAWSLFVNVLNVPLLALMFAGEYLYRVALYPDYPHASIARALRAFAQDASISTGAKTR